MSSAAGLPSYKASGRSGIAGLLGWLVLVCVLGSCGKAGPFVTLNLSDFPPEATAVALKITANGVTKEQRFSGNDSLSRITVEFAVGTRGEAVFLAQAEVSSGCVLGSGQTTVQIEDDVAYDADARIELASLIRCGVHAFLLTVEKTGLGQGTVTSEPAGMVCDASCLKQTFEFRALSQVKLLAQPKGNDLFDGFSGGCQSISTECTFTITKDTTVRAAFNQCHGFCAMPPTGTNEDLFAVWGSSATDVYAVGAAGVVLRWDGSQFQRLQSGVTSALRAVSAPRDNPSRVLMGGDGGVLLEKSGTTLKAFPKSPGTFQILAIGGSKANEHLYVAGSDGNYKRWDGKNFTTPNWYGNKKTLTGISFVAGSDEHFLSGIEGVLVRNHVGDIVPFPGQTTNTTVNLNAVWVSPAAVYLVGDGGTIVRRALGNGQDGVVMQSNVTARLRGVSGTDDQHLFAVGDSGTTLVGDGKNWAALPSNTSRQLNGVFAADANTVIAVGGAGTALIYQP